MSIAALLLFIRALGLTLPLTIVAGWSAAEAAIFFLVADIPISWIAVKSGARAAMLAALVAAIASVVGTMAVLIWAGHDASGAVTTMAALPGIDERLVEKAARLYTEGPQAVLVGAFSGIPFKLFALEAAKQGHVWFLLLAPFLRLPRFLAVAIFAGWVSSRLHQRMSLRRRLWLLILLWVLFYAVYFAAMPG